MRAARLAKGVAVLFAQRVLENVGMDVLVVLCSRAVEWAACSTGSDDRLLRTLECGLRATLLNQELLQSIGSQATSACIPFLKVAVPLVPTYAAYTLATSKGTDHVEPAAGEEAAAVLGADGSANAVEDAVGVQQAAKAAELLPPWVVLGTTLAARAASNWLVEEVLNLYKPAPEELEMVPLSGRLRPRLPNRGRLDLVAEQLSQRRVLWVDDLQGRPLEVRVEQQQDLYGAVRLAAEFLAPQLWGKGVPVLAEDDPAAQHALGTANKLLASPDFWLPRRHGGMASGVVDRFQDWRRAVPVVGLAVVDAGRANALGFAYRKRPGGGIACSRPVTLPQGQGRAVAANEEVMRVHGCNSGPSIVVEKQVMLTPAGTGIMAHELTHWLCRHTAETADAQVRGMLDLWVRGVVYTCLRPLVRRVAARAVGCDLSALTGDGSAHKGLRPRLLFMLGTLLSDICMGFFKMWMEERVGAPLFVGPQLSNTANLGLVREMEAEQGALLLLASAGYDPMEHLHVGISMELAKAVGDGDVWAGMAKLGSIPASALVLSEFDLAHWPDPLKVAWAHAQVLKEALKVYKATAVEGQNSPGSSNAE